MRTPSPLRQLLSTPLAGIGTWAVVAVGLAASPGGSRAAGADGDPVDFNRDVLPILAGTCFVCHGPDEETREADLALHTREGLFAPLDQDLSIVIPGDLGGSELYWRVSTDSENDRMPPFWGDVPPLEPEEIETLRRWIEEGAPWASHWAYVPPERPEVPAVDRGAEVRNPIDAFVLARLAEPGLEPAAEASPTTLIRRASLDLLGLPPTVEEVDAFLADHAEDPDGAWGRLLDRLLASPRYGEKQARLWLDLARYADSHGYEKDERRVMWPWRDWVIDAFNDDLPFDAFTVKQLAGDLLPEPTHGDLVATGFHRNTMINREGGVDAEEFRDAAVKDRVDTTATVWMGSTMACAQCHDHKYDPFLQEEYYRLYAVFNSTADGGSSVEPVVTAPTSEQEQRIGELEERLTQLVGVGSDPNDGVTRSPWRLAGPFTEETGDTAWTVVHGPALEHLEGREHAPEYPRRQGIEGPPVSWEEHADWVDGRVHALTGEASAFYLRRTLTVEGTRPALLQLGSDDALEVYLNGTRVHHNDARRGAAPGQDRVLVDLEDGENRLLLKVVNHGGPAGFAFDLRSAPAPGLLEERLAVEEELAALQTAIPTAMVMRELDTPRPSHVHGRGSFLSPEEPVEPGVPAVLGAAEVPDGATLDRLAFARWLVEPDHPLTARVAVNRFWEQIFGAGLVRTSDDFGTRGDRPTHPALLDWLAVEFVEGGWSVKELHRTILSSATYRRSSHATPAQLEADPTNALLARGPRFRVNAEAVRDVALATAGLLDARIGGPSVFPPQPDGIWAMTYSGDAWTTDTGPSRFRRGIYTFLRRTAPYPSMLTFDATSRELTCARRSRTNTPLQALTTLNDPVFLEAAGGLAARMTEHAGSDEDRLRFGFRACTARAPSAEELAVLVELLTGERAHYAASADASTLVEAAYPGAAPATAPAELAPWIVLANVLLNLDETLTKG